MTARESSSDEDESNDDFVFGDMNISSDDDATTKQNTSKDNANGLIDFFDEKCNLNVFEPYWFMNKNNILDDVKDNQNTKFQEISQSNSQNFGHRRRTKATSKKEVSTTLYQCEYMYAIGKYTKSLELIEQIFLNHKIDIKSQFGNELTDILLRCINKCDATKKCNNNGEMNIDKHIGNLLTRDCLSSIEISLLITMKRNRNNNNNNNIDNYNKCIDYALKLIEKEPNGHPLYYVYFVIILRQMIENIGNINSEMSDNKINKINKNNKNNNNFEIMNNLCNVYFLSLLRCFNDLNFLVNNAHYQISKQFYQFLLNDYILIYLHKELFEKQSWLFKNNVNFDNSNNNNSNKHNIFELMDIFCNEMKYNMIKFVSFIQNLTNFQLYFNCKPKSTKTSKMTKQNDKNTTNNNNDNKKDMFLFDYFNFTYKYIVLEWIPFDKNSVKKRHNKMENGSNSQKSVKNCLKCGQCDETFANEIDLLLHSKKHQQRAPTSLINDI